MLFLLTPARTVMAAACPMRSSLRLGWRNCVQPPPTAPSEETKKPAFRKKTKCVVTSLSCVNKTHDRSQKKKKSKIIPISFWMIHLRTLHIIIKKGVKLFPQKNNLHILFIMEKKKEYYFKLA